jgi:uncharacterized protein (DUF433 family)
MNETLIQADPVPLEADADGVIRVAGTRVTLDTVVAAFQNGATPEAIVQQYPAIGLDDAYSVVGYFLRHREQIETYLAARSRAAEQVQQQNEARNPPVGIRDRLMARKASQHP